MFKTILKNSYKINTKGLREVTDIYSGCDKLFENETDVVGMKAMLTNFGPEELADTVDLAERLYETFEKPVTLCLAMSRDRNVTVKEMSIKSEADFTIKLAVIDMHEIAIEKIKKNISNGTADDADRQVLESMPMMVPAYMRKEVRKECFKLLNAF